MFALLSLVNMMSLIVIKKSTKSKKYCIHQVSTKKQFNPKEFSMVPHRRKRKVHIHLKLFVDSNECGLFSRENHLLYHIMAKNIPKI